MQHQLIVSCWYLYYHSNVAPIKNSDESHYYYYEKLSKFFKAIKCSPTPNEVKTYCFEHRPELNPVDVAASLL